MSGMTDPLPGLKNSRLAVQYDVDLVTRLQFLDVNNNDGTTQELLPIRGTRTTDVSYIARLPDEILVEIFTVLAHDCRNARSIPGRFQWLVITQVSRHWIIIALAHATLWASDVMLSDNLRRVQAWLRRSKAAPLEISTPDYDDASLSVSPEVLKTLQPSAHRIKSLRLVFTMALVRSLTDSPLLDLPILEKLHLKLRNTGEHGDPEGFWILSEAPMPSLKELVLEWIPPSLFRAFCRSTLTRLFFKFCAISARDCLDILAALPSLEVVAMLGSVHMFCMDAPSPIRAVQMPHMRKIYIEENEDYAAVALLLDHLRLSSTCCMHLCIDVSENFSILSSAVRAKLSGTQLDSCTIYFSRKSLVLDLWSGSAGFRPGGYHEHPLSITSDDPQPVLHLEIALLNVGCPNALQARLSSSLDFLPSNLSTVKALSWITPDLSKGDDRYTRFILRKFDHIRTLHHTHSDPCGALYYLTYPLSRRPYTVPLPRLQHLILHDVEWHRHGSRCDPPYEGDAPVEAIEDMLEARYYKMGVPLQSLVIDNPRNFNEKEDMQWFHDMATMTEGSGFEMVYRGGTNASGDGEECQFCAFYDAYESDKYWDSECSE